MTYPGFELIGGGGEVLAQLPGTIRLSSAVGRPDNYHWDRPPGSQAWFPLGDGLPDQRPTATLSGEVWYESGDQAAADIERYGYALSAARSVNFKGQPFASLSSVMPGSMAATHGAMRRHVTYTFTLNVGDYITTTGVTYAPGEPPQSQPGDYFPGTSSGSNRGYTKLSLLEDVSIASPVNGQYLVYNSTSGMWGASTLADKVGTLASLTTTAKTNTVAAINEVNSKLGALSGQIGALGNLNTAAKGDLVAAINEVKASIPSGSGSSGSSGSTTLNGLTDVTIASPVEGQILRRSGTQWVNSPDKVGALSNLNTTAKGDLVSAINEVATRVNNTPTQTTAQANDVKHFTLSSTVSGSSTKLTTVDVPAMTCLRMKFTLIYVTADSFGYAQALYGDYQLFLINTGDGVKTADGTNFGQLGVSPYFTSRRFKIPNSPEGDGYPAMDLLGRTRTVQQGDSVDILFNSAGSGTKENLTMLTTVFERTSIPMPTQ